MHTSHHRLVELLTEGHPLERLPELIALLQGMSSLEVVVRWASECLPSMPAESAVALRTALREVDPPALYEVFTIGTALLNTRQDASFLTSLRWHHLDEALVQELLAAYSASGKAVYLAALGGTRDPRVVSAAEASLESRDPNIQEAAADVLGDMGTNMHCRGLLALLKSPYREVRAASASALGTLRCSEAIDALEKALSDSGLEVRISAAKALGQIGAVDKRAALERLLQDIMPVKLAALEAIEALDSYR